MRYRMQVLPPTQHTPSPSLFCHAIFACELPFSGVLLASGPNEKDALACAVKRHCS